MTNKPKMDKPSDPLVPIYEYIKRIDECVKYATDTETAYMSE